MQSTTAPICQSPWTSLSYSKISISGNIANQIAPQNNSTTGTDSFSFSSESLLLSSQDASASANTTDNDSQSVWNNIKANDPIHKMVKDILAKVLGQLDNTGSTSDSTSATQASNNDQNSSSTYWNSANTSQRIIDFAMSFQGESGEDYATYLNKVKEAVQTGFNEANQDLGQTSSNAPQLTQDTCKATMDKFDALLKSYQQTGKIPDPESVSNIDNSDINNNSNQSNSSSNDTGEFLSISITNLQYSNYGNMSNPNNSSNGINLVA